MTGKKAVANCLLATALYSSVFLFAFLALLVLKLVGVIEWSWWLVTLPIWAPLGLLFVVVLAVLVFLGIAAVIDLSLSEEF